MMPLSNRPINDLEYLPFIMLTQLWDYICYVIHNTDSSVYVKVL